MLDPTQVHPKLRQNSVFIQTPQGAFFKSEQTSFVLKGPTVYRWICALQPHLTGEHTLEELCASLPPAQREAAQKLVTALMAKGAVKDHQPEQPDRLSDAVRARFATQIEFIDHYRDQAIEAFAAFRDSRVLLVGAGESFLALGRALLRNGLRAPVIAPSFGARRHFAVLEAELPTLPDAQVGTAGSAEVADYDAVVYCSDQPSLTEIARLARTCRQAEVPFLPATFLPGKVMLGPTTAGSGDPCWECALLRLAANDSRRGSQIWRRLALGDGHRHGVDAPALLARMVGTALAFEVFGLRSGLPTVETRAGVIIQDPRTLDSSRDVVRPHPLCSTCGPASPDGPAASTAPEFVSPTEVAARDAIAESRAVIAGDRDAPADLSPQDYFTRQLPLIGAEVGVFRAFTDNALPQVPLKLARLEFGSPDVAGGDITVGAVDLGDLWQARSKAVREACRRYAELVGPARVRFATAARLTATGADVIEARHLSTWSGGVAPAEDEPIAWVVAISALTGQAHHVPAAAVFPDSELNSATLFEVTPAGSAAAPTYAETLRTGLLGALGFESLRALAAGRGGLSAIDSDWVRSGDSDVDYLMKCAQHLGYDVELSTVTGTALGYVVRATARGAAGPADVRTGVGLSLLEAAAEALTELVGHLQHRHLADDEAPVFGLDLLPDLCDEVLDQNRASQPQSQVFTVEQILRTLADQGRDVLFVHTTTGELLATGTVVTGRVLLTE